VPKVYVERGPGRCPAAVAGSPQKVAPAVSPQTGGRSVGVRRSLQQGAGSRPTQGHTGR
jgi:hypothetical protein